MEHDKQYSYSILGFSDLEARKVRYCNISSEARLKYFRFSTTTHLLGLKLKAFNSSHSESCARINLLAFHKQSDDAMSAVSFSPGERVLCYHGPLIYESKILKGEVWDEANTKLETVGPHYLVHYKGWKQTCVSAPISPSLVF